jgi:hypothetical protein
MPKSETQNSVWGGLAPYAFFQPQNGVDQTSAPLMHQDAMRREDTVMVKAHMPQKPSRQEKPLAMHGDYAMVVAGYDVKAMERAIKVADEEAEGCTNVSKTFGAPVLPQTTKSPPHSRFRALRFAAQNYDKLSAFPLAHVCCHMVGNFVSRTRCSFNFFNLHVHLST